MGFPCIFGLRGNKRGRARLAPRHNPTIDAFYQRLLAAGKPEKVAPLTEHRVQALRAQTNAPTHRQSRASG
ncbi:hypothetical protein D5047_04300 [Verminephrobacter eiseniae]|nr:hypothetical protein [Verminephrobacter eiseniae]